MITVAITTCNRASMLRNALESVRRQTARAAISQVIVSENSTNDESRAVCADFPELAVTYLLQSPPVPPLLHFRQMYPSISNPLIAGVHDDDWWAPDHLERALAVFETTPTCAAVYSGFYDTGGPSLPYQSSCQKDWRIWLVSGMDWRSPSILLDDDSVLAICLLEFHFHGSTLVVKRDALVDAYEKVVDSGNAFDNDRQLPIYMTKQGKLAYLPHPSVFVRRHAAQDALRPEYEKNRTERQAQTARHLMSEYGSKVASAAARFNEALTRLEPKEAVHVQEALWAVGEPLRSLLIEECGFHLQPTPKPPRRGLKYFLAQVTPPLLLTAWRKMKSPLLERGR